MDITNLFSKRGHFRHNLIIFNIIEIWEHCSPPNKKLSTNMVIDHCTLNKQTWMIPHFDQHVTADAKMYHTRLYVKCTIIYDHICTQFWRSVSGPGHGNAILNKLTRPTRVRSPDPNQYLWWYVTYIERT